MNTSRTKTTLIQISQLFGVTALLSGCVFGENKQFFSELNPSNTLETESVPAQGLNPETSPTPSLSSTSPTPTPDPSGTPNPGALLSKTDLFQVALTQSKKIDVLFCIDNSGSMADNQRVLADSFSGFINGFVSEGLDFHIGIITSDVDSTSSSSWASRMPGYVSPNRGRVLTRYSSDRYLTQQSAGLVSKFQDNALVGTQGSSREQCLNSFIYAMESAQVSGGGWNYGFFRPDSLLAFVVVSDENEDIQNNETIEARVQRLKARIAEISTTASRGNRFDFIINKSVSAPRYTPAPGELQYYPARYYAAANLLSAQTYDISRNFSNDLLSISQGMIQQATREFKLTQTPSPASSIVVNIAGQTLSSDPINGYVYHAERNTIELMGRAASDAVGNTLSITYNY